MKLLLALIKKKNITDSTLFLDLCMCSSTAEIFADTFLLFRIPLQFPQRRIHLFNSHRNITESLGLTQSTVCHAQGHFSRGDGRCHRGQTGNSLADMTTPHLPSPQLWSLYLNVKYFTFILYLHSKM